MAGAVQSAAGGMISGMVSGAFAGAALSMSGNPMFCFVAGTTVRTTVYNLMGFRKWFGLFYTYVPDGSIERHKTLTKLSILRLPKKEAKTLDMRIKEYEEQQTAAEQQKQEAEKEKL